MLSITVLNYNYGRYLAACLDSILRQSYREFEVIVIDDCSTDNSLEVIQPYLADERVRLVHHQKNCGYIASLVEGTEQHSTGEYLTVISADDVVLRDDAFARQIGLLEQHPAAAFCFSAYEVFDSGTGRVLRTAEPFATDTVLPAGEALEPLLTDITVQVLHSGTIIRKSAYQRAGGYRPELTMACDFALWPALALCGDVVYCADKLYGWRQHESQDTKAVAKAKTLTGEILVALRRTFTLAERHGTPLRGDVRRRALRRCLLMIPLDHAFSGRPRLALAYCMAAARLRPGEVLLARQFWIALLRIGLGGRLFNVVHAMARRGRSRRRAEFGDDDRAARLGGGVV